MHIKQVGFGRIKSIDIARGIAILVMLGNHLLDATMLRSYQDYAFHSTWTFLRSFTAPLFLVISGCAIFVATKKKWETHINFGANFRKRLGRGLFLILVGYILQLPTPYFAELIRLDEAQTLKFIASDILRLIGFTLIIIEILVVALRTEKRFIITSLILLIIGLIASPYIWEIAWGNIPQRIFQAFFNTAGVRDAIVASSFTFFPYGLFVFAGLFLGWFWTQPKMLESNQKRWLIVAISSVLIILLGTLIKAIFDENWIHWRTRPSHFLHNLGGAVIIILFIDLLSTLLRPHKIFQTAGTETLAIYILHLPIIYGSVYNKGLNHYFYNSWSIFTCLFVFLMLAAFMIAFANIWHLFKSKFKRGKYILVASIIAIIILNGFLEFI